ncbi:hypothetical protein [Anaerofustis sp.]|uniref:hypothetical protein n=1 Tax=Anaerofustis sp. TaxID=1872517 RepID=UPI0025B7AD47|nr:hypothetical protein [Anaerofustis sp.]
MKLDEDKIEMLRYETGRDYGFCEKALIRSRNNYDKALEYIENYDDRYFIRLYKHIVAISFGEKSYRFRINSMDENIMDIPLLIPVILCLIIPIPSIFIALLMILIMITNSSITLDVINSEDVFIPIKKREKIKKKNNKANKSKTSIGHTKIIKDDEGFNIIDII